MEDQKAREEVAFEKNNCILCGEGPGARELFGTLLFNTSFSGYAFSARRARKREHYRIVECEQCSLVRSDPVLSEQTINELYVQSKFMYSDEVPFAAKTYADLMLNLAAKHSIKVESLMEIGCGTGFFLDKLIEAGIKDVTGFEPSNDCLAHASDKVRERIICDIFKPESLQGRKFDMVCSFQTFDHLRDPLQALADIKKILKPGGHVLVVCHDAKSWSAKLLGENSPIFDIEHIFLFSRKTSRLLFEKAGLAVVDSGPLANTYPLGYWMRMIPFANKMLGAVPGAIRRLPVSLNAGNLFILGRA